MISKIKGLLAYKGFNLYLIIANILIALIGVVLVLALDGGQMKINDNSKTIIYVCGIIGLVVDLASLFIKYDIAKNILPLISTLMYAIALGRSINLVAYPLADIMTKVNWFGGSFSVYFTYFIFFLVATIMSLINCFLNKKIINKSC